MICFLKQDKGVLRKSNTSVRDTDGRPISMCLVHLVVGSWVSGLNKSLESRDESVADEGGDLHTFWRCWG